MASVREFFDNLESQADASKTAGMTNSYLFDIDGAGKWRVDVKDGTVSVTENDECTASFRDSTAEGAAISPDVGVDDPCPMLHCGFNRSVG